MKKALILTAIAVVGIIGANLYVKSLYENYIKTSEELLWTLEEMCEQNDLPWEDYCEARKNLGLNYFKHYSKR